MRIEPYPFTGIRGTEPKDIGVVEALSIFVFVLKCALKTAGAQFKNFIL